LVDPKIDGPTRGRRAMADLLYCFLEESKYMVDELKPIAEERLKVLADALQEEQLLIRNKRDGKLRGVAGAPRPGSTDVIKMYLGEAGELAYRELSGVAHANPTALVRQTQVVNVDAPEGFQVVQPGISLATLVPRLALVHSAFTTAMTPTVRLRGWDRDKWRSWEVEAGQALVRLLRSVDRHPAVVLPPTRSLP